MSTKRRTCEEANSTSNHDPPPFAGGGRAEEELPAPAEQAIRRQEERRAGAVRNAVSGYVERGWRVVPVPDGRKAPALHNWPHLRVTPENLDHYFPPVESLNVGIILGEPSGG